MQSLARCFFILVYILFTGGPGLSEDSLLLQTIVQTLQKRESFFAHCAITWDARIEVIDYPLENPERFLEALEQWDRQRLDAEITPKAKEEFLQKAQQTHRCHYQTTITVMRSGSITSIRFKEGGSCENGYIKTVPIYILCDDEQRYSVIYGAGIHAGVDSEPQIWIFRHSSPAPLNFTSGTQFIYPIDWAFLANFSIMNVAGLNRKNAWRVIKQTHSEVILEAELDGGAVYSNPRRFRVGLSKQHGYAPSWIEEYSPAKIAASNKIYYQSFPTIKIKVLAWKKVGGFWMPQRWERVRQLGKEMSKAIRISHMERRIINLYFLNFETNEIKKNFPMRTPVLDFRLCGTDIPYGDVSEVAEGCVVSYQWKGALPSLDRLERMAHHQALVQGERPHLAFQWMRRLLQWGIPLLLIAVGLYWWWRTRRS